MNIELQNNNHHENNEFEIIKAKTYLFLSYTHCCKTNLEHKLKNLLALWTVQGIPWTVDGITYLLFSHQWWRVTEGTP